jgi:hypothetical protein
VTWISQCIWDVRILFRSSQTSSINYRLGEGDVLQNRSFEGKLKATKPRAAACRDYLSVQTRTWSRTKTNRYSAQFPSNTRMILVCYMRYLVSKDRTTEYRCRGKSRQPTLAEKLRTRLAQAAISFLLA